LINLRTTDLLKSQIIDDPEELSANFSSTMTMPNMNSSLWIEKGS